jgi:hypothetical protein
MFELRLITSARKVRHVLCLCETFFGRRMPDVNPCETQNYVQVYAQNAQTRVDVALDICKFARLTEYRSHKLKGGDKLKDCRPITLTDGS